MSTKWLAWNFYFRPSYCIFPQNSRPWVFTATCFQVYSVRQADIQITDIVIISALNLDLPRAWLAQTILKITVSETWQQKVRSGHVYIGSTQNTKHSIWLHCLSHVILKYIWDNISTTVRWFCRSMRTFDEDHWAEYLRIFKFLSSWLQCINSAKLYSKWYKGRRMWLVVLTLPKVR